MSTTILAIVTMVGGPFLIRLGFSEVCANEFIALAPTVAGGAFLWLKRVKQGDVNVFGVRKV